MTPNDVQDRHMRAEEMPAETLSRELIRKLRGRRSQMQLSRKLGLRSNLAYRWENGRAWPSPQQLFAICRVAGVPIETSLATYLRMPISQLETTHGVSALCRALAGSQPLGELAARIGRSRYVVSRWLSGKSDLRLPDFLRFVEATTRRLLDVLSLITDPAGLPSIAPEWQRMQIAREAAYEAPWSHAILRALELDDLEAASPRALDRIAARLALSRDEVARCMDLLVRSGQVRVRKGRYSATDSAFMDTGIDRARRLRLQAFWSHAALERMSGDESQTGAFNLFTIAEQDLLELRNLHAQFFEQMRNLIARSKTNDRVAVYVANIVALDRPARIKLARA
jgi:transcriptional regulator with XRE-family HTH domain